ncbi:MAG: glycosyltransferase [Nitrospiraceae bacterium]|nr:glycosyltransferase [Nitrospiraceae bacterium]
MRVSVVIPTWNQKTLLTGCLESLARQTFQDFDTWVVDDASTDGTALEVGGRFPWVQVHRRDRNGGFCVAVNAGIERAAGDYVVLLNDDMTLAPDFLERLVDAAESSGAGLVAPLILWRDEPDVIYGAGDTQWVSGRPESIGFRCPLEGFDFSDKVFGVCAGAALYRREVFEQVGVFDTRFDIYFSDSDLSFRARLSGFDARFARDAVAYHVGSASLDGRTLKRTCQCYVNHMLLVVKNMPLGVLIRHAPAIIRERMHQARRVFSAARVEAGAFHGIRTLFGAWWSMLGVMPHALRERRRIQAARQLSAGELEALLKR